MLERVGYQWFGVDYYDEQAPILADGHALPFKDGTFDMVFSVAVIECFAHPQVAMAEAARVLRPGGRYMASVAFQSPYIPYSQFHYSHVGVLGTLHGAGLKPEVIMADRRWSALEASAVLGLFPRLNRRVAIALVRPVAGLSRLWWATARRLPGRPADRPITVEEQVLRTAGDLEFVAIKPVSSA